MDSITLFAVLRGFPGGSDGKQSACSVGDAGDPGLIPGLGGMVNHSSILAWRILWTEDPGRLRPWGHRVTHNWATNIFILLSWWRDAFFSKQCQLKFISLCRSVTWETEWISFLRYEHKEHAFIRVSYMDKREAFFLFPPNTYQFLISMFWTSGEEHCWDTSSAPFVCIQLFATPWTVALRASVSIRFSRQEYWSGFSFSSPGDLPNPGINSRFPASPALTGRFFNYWAPREGQMWPYSSLNP